MFDDLTITHFYKIYSKGVGMCLFFLGEVVLRNDATKEEP
jgi:hypothetical protein